MSLQHGGKFPALYLDLTQFLASMSTVFLKKFSGITQGKECIAILTVTSPIVINVPTRGLLPVKTKDSFVLWLAKFKYQKTCL